MRAEYFNTLAHTLGIGFALCKHARGDANKTSTVVAANANVAARLGFPPGSAAHAED